MTSIKRFLPSTFNIQFSSARGLAQSKTLRVSWALQDFFRSLKIKNRSIQSGQLLTAGGFLPATRDCPPRMSAGNRSYFILEFILIALAWH
jgi:hypothetical protein